MQWILLIFIGISLGTVITACSTLPPENPDNICLIFKEKRNWYTSAMDMSKKWGAPIHVSMSIMYQESAFDRHARPPYDYLLGFIPWGRVTTATGYSQATDSTWDIYIKETNNVWARRDNFDDSIDFIGWYIYKTHKLNKVSKWDAKLQYLNYHEGWGGYTRQTHNKKKWLLATAARVDNRAKKYAGQYNQCKTELDKNWLQRLFS